MHKQSLLLCTVGVLVAILAPVALAGWSSSVSAGPLPVSSATIAAPTGATATTSACTKHDATTLQATVSWTATTSSVATGYAIKRGTSPSGPFTRVGTVSGQNTTTWTDGTAVLAYNATYYYVVDTTVASWTSPDSNAASVTMPNKNCRGGT